MRRNLVFAAMALVVLFAVPAVATAQDEAKNCQNVKLICKDIEHTYFLGCVYGKGMSEIYCSMAAQDEYIKCMYNGGCNPFITKLNRRSRNAYTFALVPARQDETRIITCSVLEPDKVVSCKVEPKSKPVILVVSGWHKDSLDEWKWRVQYMDQPEGGRAIAFNAPLVKTELKAGQKVKLMIHVDGSLEPLADYDVRTYRKVEEFGRHGQPPPASARRPPDDCQEVKP